MNNPTALPLIVTVACAAGSFHWIDVTSGSVPWSLMANWVFTPEAGAIAAISATATIATFEGLWLGVGMHQGLFDHTGTGNLPAFLSMDPLEASRTLGAVAFSGQMRLWIQFGDLANEGIHTGVIIGDPATRLKIHRY